jgi:hypothetical protein
MDLLYFSIIYGTLKNLYDHLAVTVQLETVLHMAHNTFTLTLSNFSLVLSKAFREFLIQCVREVAVHLGYNT